MIGCTELLKDKVDEVKAIQSLLNSIQILERNLSKICNLPEKTFPNAAEMTVSKIVTEHLKEGFLDTSEIKEMKSILRSLYFKLEDTVL